MTPRTIYILEQAIRTLCRIEAALALAVRCARVGTSCAPDSA